MDLRIGMMDEGGARLDECRQRPCPVDTAGLFSWPHRSEQQRRTPQGSAALEHRTRRSDETRSSQCVEGRLEAI